MSLKDELNYVKEELSSDEKLLESAFRLEKFYRKHRVKIFALLALILLGFGAKAGYGVWQEHRLQQANAALLTLEKNPTDQVALAELEAKNPKLYTLYLYSTGVDEGSTQRIKEAEVSGDERIKDLARYHEAVLAMQAGDSRYYPDLSKVEKAYLALKAGKKEEARRTLALIAENSPVAPVARLLRHATLK